MPRLKLSSADITYLTGQAESTEKNSAGSNSIRRLKPKSKPFDLPQGLLFNLLPPSLSCFAREPCSAGSFEPEHKRTLHMIREDAEETSYTPTFRLTEARPVVACSKRSQLWRGPASEISASPQDSGLLRRRGQVRTARLLQRPLSESGIKTILEERKTRGAGSISGEVHPPMAGRKGCKTILSLTEPTGVTENL